MSTHGTETLGLVGIGLIGSSLARAAARAGVSRVVFHDADPQASARARVLGLGQAAASVGEVCARADLTIVCTPPGHLVEVMRECVAHLPPGAVLSDVGSVKRPVVEAVRAMEGSDRVVPGHPIAGTERSGPDAGRADLFRNRWCVLTPEDEGAPAVARVREFWRAVGAQVRLMDASRHDTIMSLTSHGPHLVAYNLVASAQRSSRIIEDDLIDLSAGGFRDFTRIAASDPVMWRDVFLLNGDRVVEAITEFRAGMDQLLEAIRAQDGRRLEEIFAQTRQVRKRIVSAGQETSAEDFGRVRLASGDQDDCSQSEE